MSSYLGNVVRPRAANCRLLAAFTKSAANVSPTQKDNYVIYVLLRPSLLRVACERFPVLYGWVGFSSMATVWSQALAKRKMVLAGRPFGPNDLRTGSRVFD